MCTVSGSLTVDESLDITVPALRQKVEFSLVKDSFAPKLPRPFPVLAPVFVPYLDAGIIKGNNKSCFLEKSFIQNWLKN